MIDIKVSVGFEITSLSKFQWHELQDLAQKVVDGYALHTIPTSISMRDFKIVTHGDTDLYVFVHFSSLTVRFLFIDLNFLSSHKNEEEPKP